MESKSDGNQVKGAFSAARLQAVLEGADDYELELASDLLSGWLTIFERWVFAGLYRSGQSVEIADLLDKLCASDRLSF
jgi:hypothetical protein